MSNEIDGRDKARGFLKGFKEFISKGNVVDLAVGVIIGTAFSKIVSSLVKDIITPLISLLLKTDSLKTATWVLREEVVNGAGDIIQTQVAIGYGSFITIIIEFIIIAFTIYAVLTLIIRRKQFIEKLEKEEAAKKKKEEKPKEKAIPEDIKLLKEIRDLLKEENKK